ncbi:poly [ADP-ribose] polymerase tankyrase-like [Anneissia japonica]|uniref:poly [ADP-ribose] polymerase tankyrase-like n=1 Tax=Anneissia japonica TaxID=1529436 RepID=UPI0014255E9C|nr:poly [ADP-ribose] polymerase tankyrase-like [Anneissia japonica]
MALRLRSRFAGKNLRCKPKFKMADEDGKVTTTPPKRRGAGSPGRSPERKRKRVQAEYYQSDVVDVFSRTAASRTPTATKEVFCDKGAFLAIRSSEGMLYLEEKKTATKRGKKKVVAVKKAGKGRKRAGSRAAVKPKPKASASLISNRLKNKAKRKLTTQKQTNKKSKPTKAKAKKPVKKKLKKVEKKVKEKKGKQPRKHPNQLLTPNTKIEIVMKDPCFEIKAENEMPEVSKAAYAKRAIRAVLTNDMVLLRKLINDKKKVASVFLDRSVDVKDDAMSYAIMNNNQAAIKLLGTELEANQGDRCRIPDSILETQGTGTYNFRTLGHATRKISMSRGSKEGNNAFTKEDHQNKEAHELSSKYAELVLKCGASKTTADVLAAISPSVQGHLSSNIVKGVREGHRKVAGQLIQQSLKAGGMGFNFLHQEVLTCNNPDELTKFKSVSVKKKTWDNDCITPLHCAAINPNPKILAKLLDSLPEYSLPDKKNMKPIHYAAACEGSGPLELLLNKSVNPEETDNQGNTPLMVAARTGRTQNIEILMRKIKANNPGEKTGLNRRGPAGKTPLHFAAENGHTDAVKALHKHGADIEAILNAGHNKETALILVCKNGHFATAKALIELNAIIEKKDKLQRTALMHAVINGHYKIVCFLLRKGANPNAKDSSGNTMVHYAAAYGWWYCLRVLLKAGGSPNTPNDWKIPPLGIAIMTGNRGCADLLMEQDDMDINFKDDNGFTIVTYLVKSSLSSSMLEELKHLVEDLKARVDMTDVNGWTALHHLTEQDVTPSYYDQANNARSKKEISIELAETLLKYGCPLSAKTDDGKTAVNLAVEQENCNTELIELLVKKGCPISLSTSKEENILHTMVERCKQNNLAGLIKLFGDRLQNSSEDITDGDGGDSNDGASIKSLAQQTDKNGLTPLNKCIYQYCNTCGRHSEEKMISSFEDMVTALVEVGNADVNQSITDDVDGKKSDDGPLKYKQTPVQMLAGCNEPVAHPLLNKLLSFKPNLDAKDGKGRTPLIISIVSNNVQAAKLFIKEGANVHISSDDLEDDGKASPLVLAARYSHFEVLQLLLSKGASVTAIDEKNKKTALHYAVCSKNTDSEILAVVRALIRKKANVNALDVNKRTPLHLAVNTNDGGTNTTAEVVEVLLEHNANVFAKDEDECLPLHYAFSKIDDLDNNSQMDPIEMATTIIESMKRNQLNSRNVRGQTPLHLAAYRGASISAMYIVERIQDYEVRDKFGNTPLATALLGGYDSMCIMLIQKGSSININVTEVTKEMLSPPKKDEATKAKFWQWKPSIVPEAKPEVKSFFRRVLENNWQGVSYLVMDRLDKFKMTFLQAVQCAFEALKFQTALTMIRKQKDTQKILAVNNRSQNLLHLLCLNAPRNQETNLQVQVAEMLSKRGLDFSRKDAYSCTAITYTAATQNNALITFFFNYDNDKFENAISTLDSIGRLPMAALFYNPTFDETTKHIIELFMRCGGSLNIRSPIPYVDPAITKFIPQPKSLTELFHGTPHRNIDQTPLIVCIRNRLFDAVSFLLKNGADLNYPDKDMVTPLMHAVKKNDDDIVKLLLNDSYTINGKSGARAGNNMYVGQPRLMWGVKKAKMPRGYGFVNSNDDDEDEVDEDDEDDESKEEEDMDVDENENENENSDEDMDSEEGNGDKKEEKKLAKKKKQIDEFVMTSKVNLNATDSRARNVIHHMIHAKEEGTYENVDMLELLVKVGASLDQKDANGKTPLDYAMSVRSSELASTIQRLQKVAKKNMVRTIHRSQFKEFLKVFKSKTGNNWSDVKNFEKQPKKYRLVNGEPYKSKKVYKQDKNASLDITLPSKLPSPVKDVMKSLTNHKMYEASMRDIHIDANYFPTRYISREILMEAKTILGKVRDKIKEIDRLRNENLLQEIEKYQGLMEEINLLSNEFYELIPHINFSYTNTSPLTDDNTLKEAAELIANLLDYEVASKVILAARYRQQDVNPLDYVYRTLDCQMQLLDKDSAEAQRVLRYVHNTKDDGDYQIEGIFHLNRKGEEERLHQTDIDNHMLLWHGSRSANLISILKKGLLVAPPEAPATGYMFGKGIYFADTFAKSANYCHSHGDDSKWMLLCEVALGKICPISNYGEYDEDKGLKGFDSVKGKGSEYPDPKETIHLPEGSKIPLGELTRRGYSFLNYNEFIVYDSSQVCLRYLVQFK